MLKIIDVSESNGAINWAAVAPHVDGAVIRVGYRGWGSGTIVRDARAIENLQQATHYKIPVGVYFVTQAVTEVEAINEAQYCHDTVTLAGVQLTLPICYDDEPAGGADGKGRRDLIGKTAKTQTALAFVDQCKRMMQTPALYCSNSWFQHMLDGESVRKEGAVIWISSYPGRRGGPSVPPTMDWDAWQFSPWERVPGIGTDCDMSYFKRSKVGGNDNMTNQEFSAAMAAYRKTLQDNDAGDWSREARDWAIKTGLMQGGGNGNYMWQDFLTREQLVTVLYRFAQQLGKA